MAENKFPDYFPDDCPPDDAEFKEIFVYRLCINADFCIEKDFLSYYNLNPKRYENFINAYGLSVYTSYESAKRSLEKLPALGKKFKSIFGGTTYVYTGKVKATPSVHNHDHYTWWLFSDIKPHLYFKLCVEETGEKNA